MDEPTASLTRHEVELLLAAIRRLKAQGVAVVFVSHRLEEVIEIAERVTVLRDGRKVGTLPGRRARRPPPCRADDRREHRAQGDGAARRRTGRPALEVRRATRAGEFADVSLHACTPAKFVGLIGLLGAGRTELALALFGMTRLDGGEICRRRRAGRVSARTAAAIAAGIAYVSEDRLALGVNLRQSIADNVAITVLDRLATASAWSRPSGGTRWRGTGSRG